MCLLHILKKIMHDIICVTGVYLREIINMFLSVWCLGLLKTLTLGCTQTP